MNYQPIINIGCLGSVSDGKSTLIEKLIGIKTQRHSKEKYRNITIKQGYANMKIWENNNNEYITTDSKENSYQDYKLVNHISFVDCPGHHDFIQTMLTSINLMNGAIVVIAVDEPIKNKPQLLQHLAAIKLKKLDKIIICMNKIDLINKNLLMIRKKELDNLLIEYDIKPFVILPTCFNKKLGLNYLVNAIMLLFNSDNFINNNQDNLPIFRISRSFDINKPGTNFDNLKGGIIGGSLFTGKLKINDEIEIRPGIINKINDNYVCTPLITQIYSIKTEEINLNTILSGGLVALGTDIDPYYCKNDLLVGNILGLKNTLPHIYIEINIDVNLTKLFGYDWNPKINDNLLLQIGITSINAILININFNILTFKLFKPVCIYDNEHIILCYYVNKLIKIIGEGNLLNSSKFIL